jgi:amino acid adenylation domain-containing protein
MTVTSTANASRREQLSVTKRELLEKRLRGRGDLSGFEIPRRPASENRVSFGQERIWFQCRVTPNQAMYHVPLLARIEGVLNVAALTAGLNEAARRHEVLRSSFVEENGAVRLNVAPEVKIRLVETDLQSFTPEAQESLVRQSAREEAYKPFDLASAPLMRVALLKLGPTRNVLFITVHHIVWDGWSSGLFIDELRKAYVAASTGAPSRLTPLRVQYSDFAHWHRHTMEGVNGRAQIAYWKAQLADLPELTTLPSDRPRPATQTHRGGHHSWRLPPEVGEGLATLSFEQGATLFVTLLSVFKTLLFHYTGQSDLVVGTTVAFRTRPELERLLGFFANALALRTRIPASASFRDVVSLVRETVLGAQANQDAPFEKIVEAICGKRGLSHNPIFQLAFVLHNLPEAKIDLPGLTISVEETSTNSATFDLVLHAFQDQTGLRARIEYDAELFDESTIRRMASNFDALARDVIQRPDTPISALSFLNEEEERELIAVSRTPAIFSPRDRLLHHLIGVDARDEAPAVFAEGDWISYGELRARARRLAHYLVSIGVGPDTPVGVFIEPSIDLIVAIVAILEADGAYLPIDPSYPEKRVEHILRDASAAVIVTMRRDASTLPKTPIPIVCLDADGAAMSAIPSCPLPGRAGPENLAYIIYTSGSTGLPKGVMVSHAAAVASTLARRQRYGLGVGAYLLLSSVSFDSSVAGIFWTLFDGGRLCVPSERQRRDPGALTTLIEREGVSTLLCLPSLYSAILQVVSSVSCVTLRRVIVAGEECKHDVVQQHFERLPSVALFNEYGPTECAVWSTVHEIRPADAERGAISIGRPSPGAELFVLGQSGALAPRGVPGELFIGGLGVTRGYRNQPDLTADRFRPNPFGGPGERLYRTGDRARLLANGEFDFIGRVDNQFKLRGYRIEPSEIEQTLQLHPDVTECAVVASAGRSGAEKLIAYILTRDANECIDFSGFLAERLPEFMIPDRFSRLDTFPRTPNGKVDRPALASLVIEERHEATPPSTATGVLLAEIWAEVLSVPTIGDNDDFFELGGNSLSAIQVVARVQRIFGRDMPIGSIFDNSTLREFAQAIDQAAQSGPLNGEISERK